MWLLERNLGGRKRGATAPQTRSESTGALFRPAQFPELPGTLERRRHPGVVVEASAVRRDEIREHA
jgi:hypothetical protein